MMIFWTVSEVPNPHWNAVDAGRMLEMDEKALIQQRLFNATDEEKEVCHLKNWLITLQTN